MRRLGRDMRLIPFFVGALLLAGCDDDDGGGSGPGDTAGDARDTSGDTTGDSGNDMIVPDLPDLTPDLGEDPTEDAVEDPTEDGDAALDLGDDVDDDAADDAGDTDDDDVADAADTGDAVDDADTDTGGGVGVLVLTEVVDGTLPLGLPKWVEVTNIGDGPVDLSEYSLGSYNNGGDLLTANPPPDGPRVALPLATTATALGPCESWVVSFEDSDSVGTGTFGDVYGDDPDNFSQSATINGDDVIALFFGTATQDGNDAELVDLYGTIGVDADPGPGTEDDAYWVYVDSYARRIVNAAPDFSGCSTLPGCTSPTFATDWLFTGADALETGDDLEEQDLLTTLTHPFLHECP